MLLHDDSDDAIKRFNDLHRQLIATLNCYPIEQFEERKELLHDQINTLYGPFGLQPEVILPGSHSAAKAPLDGVAVDTILRELVQATVSLKLAHIQVLAVRKYVVHCVQDRQGRSLVWRRGRLDVYQNVTPWHAFSKAITFDFLSKIVRATLTAPEWDMYKRYSAGWLPFIADRPAVLDFQRHMSYYVLGTKPPADHFVRQRREFFERILTPEVLRRRLAHVSATISV